MKHDPRATPAGRVIRKLSIDELFQLFNVLAGHMSRIGPRELPTYEVEMIEPWQRRRFSMRPGLTCLRRVFQALLDVSRQLLTLSKEKRPIANVTARRYLKLQREHGILTWNLTSWFKCKY